MISYNKELGYRYLDLSNDIRVGTLVQDKITPEFIAATLATYSRSARSLIEIIQDRYDNQVEASEKCKLIIDGYGHGSIRGMGHIPLFIEGISIFDAMSIFYESPFQDGQERSTRYQKMSGVDDCYMPPLPAGIMKDYTSLLQYWMDCYSSLYSITMDNLKEHFQLNTSSQDINKILRSRTLDCTRFFLPLAKCTSIGLIANGNEISRIIRGLYRLPHMMDLARGINDLLNQPGTSTLIRHIEPFPTPTKEILELLLNEINIETVDGTLDKTRSDYSLINNININDVSNISNGGILFSEWEGRLDNSCLYVLDKIDSPLTANHLRLIKPLMKESYYFSETLLREVGNLIGTYYNQYRDMGNLGRTGDITLTGLTDIGTLKDLNRHRTLNKLVPILHTHCSIEEELKRRSLDELYTLPEYLLKIDSLSDLSDRYRKAFQTGYNRLLEYFYKWKGEINEDILNLSTKLLLPHGHLTSFTYSGSYWDWVYLTGVRTRPDGHINYRLLTSKMAQLIGDSRAEFVSSITDVSVDSIDEFLGRS